MGGHRDLDQDIGSSFACWPVYQSACSRETEPTEIPGYIRRDLLWEWAHKIVEAAEKSHSMPPASWRTRKADGTVQPELEGTRTRSCDVQEQEKNRRLSSGERERICPPSTFFVLVQPQRMVGCPPTLLGTIFNYSVFRLKCRWIFSGNTLAATPSIRASLTCSINDLPPAQMLGRFTASGRR